MDIAKVKERLYEVSPGFALALLAPGETKADAEKAVARFEGGEGCPILAMAEGVGILRAMTVRCDGFPDGFALIKGWPTGQDGAKFGAIYKLTLIQDTPVLYFMICKFFPNKE